MDICLQEIVEAVARDAHSGASDMVIDVAKSIISLSDEDFASLTTLDWKEFSIELHKAKPSIATIFNLANAIMLVSEQETYDINNIRNIIVNIIEQERSSVELIANIAGRIIDADHIITSSYSSTVGAALSSIASRKSLSVTVAESLPGGEGRQFAMKLQEMGISAEIIPDSNIFARMSDADCILTGADSLTPLGLVNKVGTRALAEAAYCFDLPAYAMCGQSKATPMRLSEMVVTEQPISDNLCERSQLFEATPLDRFTFIIMEDGLLTPDQTLNMLENREMAKVWDSLIY